VRRFCSYLPLFALALACAPFANAQAGFDIGVGFGGSRAPAAKTGIDTNLQNCILGTPGCQSTPDLNSFMMGFKFDLMAWNKFGIGAQYNFEPTRTDYVTFPTANNFSYALQSRVAFYDFNGILSPIRAKNAQLKISGGIGGAQIKFYESGSSTTGLTGTQSYSQYFGSSNHFAEHAAVGVQIYPTGGNWFLRPEFDYHHVHNLHQFGSNNVIRYSVWVGYTLGR
jgi:hypothetical protein